MKKEPGEILTREIMQSNVICVSPEASLTEVRDLFVRHRISGAPVVDEEGLVGVISMTDVIRTAFSKDSEDYPENAFFVGLPPMYGSEIGSLGEQLEDKIVEDAMTTDVYTVSPDDRLSVVAVTMRHHKIHRVIVTEGKQVVGIVSALDLIQVLENH